MYVAFSNGIRDGIRSSLEGGGLGGVIAAWNPQAARRINGILVRGDIQDCWLSDNCQKGPWVRIIIRISAIQTKKIVYSSCIMFRKLIESAKEGNLGRWSPSLHQLPVCDMPIASKKIHIGGAGWYDWRKENADAVSQVSRESSAFCCNAHGLHKVLYFKLKKILHYLIICTIDETGICIRSASITGSSTIIQQSSAGAAGSVNPCLGVEPDMLDFSAWGRYSSMSSWFCSIFGHSQ